MGARQRRDNLRRTWVPTGKDLRRLEEERGIVIRFVIGYRSAVNSHSIQHWLQSATGFAALQAPRCSVVCMLASDATPPLFTMEDVKCSSKDPQNTLIQTNWLWMVQCA